MLHFKGPVTLTKNVYSGNDRNLTEVRGSKLIPNSVGKLRNTNLMFQCLARLRVPGVFFHIAGCE